MNHAAIPITIGSTTDIGALSKMTLMGLLNSRYTSIHSLSYSTTSSSSLFFTSTHIKEKHQALRIILRKLDTLRYLSYNQLDTRFHMISDVTSTQSTPPKLFSIVTRIWLERITLQDLKYHLRCAGCVA